MANFSRCPSPIQARNPSLLRKSVDLSSQGLNLSSPSDFTKKSFSSKHFPSEKENEQDLSASNPTKGISPVTTSSPKGTPIRKNFMAPTISASSKAVAPPCHRKRVLGERNNEGVKSMHASAQAEDTAVPIVRFPLVSTQVEETLERSNNSSFLSSQIKEATSLYEHTATSHITSSQIRAETTTQTDTSQSASLPPYDPKVNYLSPRPRFLHYKPKSQADLVGNELDFLNSNPRNLENIFSSESSDDSSSVETEEEIEEATLSHTEFPSIESQQNEVPAKKGRLKFRHLFLVLLIGCICLRFSDSPNLASFSNPKASPVKFFGYQTTILLDVSNKLNDWLPDYFSYPFARQPSKEVNIFPWANLTCLMDEKSRSIDEGGTYPKISGENNIEMANKMKKSPPSFDMVLKENEVLDIQAQHEIGKIEEEEKETEIDASSTSEQQEMVASSTISEMVSQPDIIEKSKPEKPKVSEPELVENQEVRGTEPIITENLVSELIEIESNDMSDEQMIQISEKTVQVVASIAVLLSLLTAIATSAFNKKKQNWAICVDKTPSLIHGSSENHVPNRISLHQNSTLDTEELSGSSFEVGTDAQTYTRTPGERHARRDSDASSCSYGSYLSYEKVSSKKVNKDGEEMTPVRRSSRLRIRAIPS